MRVLVLSLLAVGLLASTASARVWTDASGTRKVDAEYLGMENMQVKLQFPSGKVMAMPLGTLSAADQQFVKEQVALAEAEKEAAAGPPDRLTQRIKDDPTNPEVYIDRGMARINRKDFDGAIKDFTKALEFNPEDAYAFNGRGLAHQKKNELVAAQQDFNQAILYEPDFPSAYRNRGENLRKLALDKKQSVPELDHAIERWQEFWNHARKSNLSRAPWQPLNATKGDVSRQAAMRQMAKIDIEYAETLERDYGWHDGGHGGHGGCHGPGCSCEGCSGTACAHCGGEGCPACGGGKPAPGLGVYPPECMKGETITLVANASQLAKGMPAEAKPGAKPNPNGPKIDVDSVDFYRDVDGDGLFNSDTDQFLAADANQGDGFSVEVSTDAFPPGPQSYFAVPRGAAGSGTGATPEELLAAAETMEKAAQTERGIAQACEAGKTQGMSADQSKAVSSDQESISDDVEKAAEKVAAASPEIAELLEEAAKPMKAVKNRMDTAQKRPGEACKGDAEGACDKANEAADKLAEAGKMLREAYEAAKASGAENPGQAPANAASGRPTSGSNEILAAAPIGPRGVGGGDGGDGGDDGYEDEIVIERALDYIEEEDYDSAIVEYDTLLEEDPDNAYYLRDRAAANLLRGGYVDAIEDYNHLLSIKDEPDADLYYNRGCAHMAAGRLQEAISDFTKSISMNETWSLAYNNRGVTYARLKEYQKAIGDFTEAIKLEAGNKLAYRNRALAYKKLGEMSKAQADYDFVVKLEQGADNDPFQN